MSDSTITAVRNVDNLRLIEGGSFTPAVQTVTVPPGTLTVTITQGEDLTLANQLSLPSSFSSPDVSVSPTTADVNNQEYVFTCINNLTASAATVTASFTVTATVTVGGSTTESTRYVGPQNPPEVKIVEHDPTMVFNPPG